MGIFEGYLLATDLDGTLLGTDKKVSKENADAIRFFQSEGGLFTVATGRYPDFLYGYSDIFTVDECVIGLNGNMIYDMKKHEVRFIARMEKDRLKNLLDTALSHFEHEIYCIKVNDDVESYEYDGKVVRDVCKSIIIASDARSAVIIRDFLNRVFGSEFKVARSWPTGVEIFKKGSGKGECLRYIRENINPDIKVTVGVGDYENDITMLEMADIGYAVKNSSDDAKAAADRVTAVDNDHGAIAFVIDDIRKELAK